MSIASLKIQHVRIIESADLTPSPITNWIVGPNASGKTSLLESVDLLSRGRSFRTRLAKDLISRQHDRLTISARVMECPEAPPTRIALSKTRQTSRSRIQGYCSNNIAGLAGVLPVQAIHPDSHQLIQGPPGHRKAFVDWGVFHVEPEFLPVWRRYMRVLRQRNSALKAHQPVTPWSDRLSADGMLLHNFRDAYLNELRPFIQRYRACLLQPESMHVQYYRGWPKDEELSDTLNRSVLTDKERGFTTKGAHRFDLAIRLGGGEVGTVGSRGQQKMAVLILKLAQVEHYMQRLGRPCVVLVDDLAAELDRLHRVRVLELLFGLRAQLFITATDLDGLQEHEHPHKTFHVEQGRVQELV